jgi:hypothetical protein
LKELRVEDAIGHILCHDFTRIVPGEMKGAQFRKGHIIRDEDIPILLSMGKEHIFVWEKEVGMLHEDEAASRLVSLCQNSGMKRSETVEGKIELTAEYAGLFRIDLPRFYAVNAIDDIIIAARHSLSAVQAGDKLAGMRVIPLVIPEAKIIQAETTAGPQPLFELMPYKLKTAGVVITGSEVANGIIKDAFTPVITEKLAACNMAISKRLIVGDGIENVAEAIAEVRLEKPDIIICTGGMSVDPDDNTPGAIRQSGASIVTYGAPVLPGSMFLLGYFPDGGAIMGLPGGAMYRGSRGGGIFDIVLPRIAAGITLTKQDFIHMGNGGLCFNCKECHYPVCPYGKTV